MRTACTGNSASSRSRNPTASWSFTIPTCTVADRSRASLGPRASALQPGHYGLHDPALQRDEVEEYERKGHTAKRVLETSLAFRGLLSRGIESHGRADQRLERIRVDLLTLVNVDGAPHVPVKARVEELGRIFHGSALEEGQLHDRLVRLSGADTAVMGPYRGSHPLPLFDNIRICLPDEGAHPCQCMTSPVTQLSNSFAD